MTSYQLDMTLGLVLKSMFLVVLIGLLSISKTLIVIFWFVFYMKPAILLSILILLRLGYL